MTTKQRGKAAENDSSTVSLTSTARPSKPTVSKACIEDLSSVLSEFSCTEALTSVSMTL